MGARICFSWDGGSWRVYPAMRLADQLRAELRRVCTGRHKTLPEHLARHITTIALTLREDRLGALLVVSSSEDMIFRLIPNRQANTPPFQPLSPPLFSAPPLFYLSP